MVRGLLRMKMHEYFSGLLTDSVNINPDRLRQLEDHEKALTDYLQSEDTFAPLIERVSRQGSWAHRTIIRPQPGCEFDADLVIHMRPQRSWSRDPRRYPEALYAAMQRSPRYRDKVKLKTRCIRVTYAGDCHVDLVPHVYMPGLGMWGQGAIINRKTNQFERAEPESFATWVRERDHTAGGHLRTSLRLLKCVRDYQGTFNVPSVILTVLVGSRVSSLSAFCGAYSDLPTAFRSLVDGTDQWLQRQWGVPQVKDPSCPSVDFSHRLDKASFTRFRDQFHGYADIVRAAYKSDDRWGSIQLWQNVFGSAFAPS
jgi:hypothetical protein